MGDDLTCPHGCGVTFNRVAQRASYKQLASSSELELAEETFRCPTCGGFTVELIGFEVQQGTRQYAWTQQVFPPNSRPLPPGTPGDLAADWTEAWAILPISPRAAAAIARRSLQHVLVGSLGAKGRDLNDQINSMDGSWPTQLIEDLHMLRHIGNFSVHPIKETLSGEVVEVEPQEAEWTLEVLEQVLDLAFTRPARQRERRIGFNKKLSSAGKDPLPLPGD